MYACCLIGFLLILIYCVFITYKDKEIPNSISQIVYSLGTRWKWTFTAVLFAVGFLIVPWMLEILLETYKFLGFLTVVGILGVGADPLVKGEKNIIHYVSAVLCGIMSQIIVLLMMPKLLFLWFPYILYTLYEEKSDKNMFLAEFVMLLSLGIVCLC